MGVAEELKKSPIFHMSLSSKELFHSNMWAWLFERSISYCQIFFKDISAKPVVKREEKHCDITFWIGDKAYIIENKFKSIPNKNQLAKYQMDAGSSFEKGVLTGIVEPSFINEPDMKLWSFVKYEEIGKKIVEIAEKEERDEFEKQLICNYGEMLKTLSLLLNEELNKSEKKWNPNSSVCKKLRLDDIYSKLLAEKLCSFLEERINEDGRTEGDYSLQISSGFTNACALVDIKYVYNDIDLNDKQQRDTVSGEKLLSLGIQIQKDKYRWICEYKDNNIGERFTGKTEKIFKDFKSYGWFVDYDCTKFTSPTPKKIKDHFTDEEHKTSLSKPHKWGDKTPVPPYGMFGTEFIHQYWNIEKSSFDQLLEYIKQDLDLARRIIKDHFSDGKLY